MAQHTRLIVLASVLLALAGCFDDDPNVNEFPDGENPAANTAPTIAGDPPTAIVEGEFYEFIPTASDADGDVLRFSVYHKPDWASFDQATGRLSGTPGAGDAGTFGNITIAAWDGKVTTSLDPFSITVNQIAMGSATLSWNPPTENSDGSPLTNLTGYKIYYGRNADSLGRSVVLNNPGLTRYVIENLEPARWFFTMTSINADGTESDRSAMVSKAIG